MSYNFELLPDRIRWAIKEVGKYGTWADFARAAKVSDPSQVRRWVGKAAESRGVDDDSLKLIERHTGVPAPWLRFGGAMPNPAVTDAVTGLPAGNGRYDLSAALARIDDSGLPEWEKRAAREQALATHRQFILEIEAQNARERTAAEKERARALAIEAENAGARSAPISPAEVPDQVQSAIEAIPQIERRLEKVEERQQQPPRRRRKTG